MIIALLAALGVSLWVLAMLVALMVFRRWWLSRQPGAFRCAVRSVEGDVSRASHRRWRRGWGRRSQGVLAWDPMPTLVGSTMLDIVRVADSRTAEHGEVRRMGDRPVIVRLAVTGNATIDVALRAEQAAVFNRREAAPGREPVTPAL